MYRTMKLSEAVRELRESQYLWVRPANGWTYQFIYDPKGIISWIRNVELNPFRTEYFCREEELEDCLLQMFGDEFLAR